MNTENSNIGPISITNNFINSIDDKDKMIDNEKGAISFTSWGVDDQRVALFTIMNRGMSRNDLKTYVRNLMAEAKKRGGIEFTQGCVDACIQAVHSRDIDEGKGERDLSYWFILEIYRYLPMSIMKIIEIFIKKYGSWLDNNRLSEIIDQDYELLKNSGKEEDIHEARNLLKLRDTLDDLYLDQLEIDYNLMNSNKYDLSLAAKWVPRENKKYTAQARRLALKNAQKKNLVDIEQLRINVKNAPKANNPWSKSSEQKYAEKKLQEGKQHAYKLWRHYIVPMNTILDTVEIHMCNGTWRQIKPNSIPARCLKIKRNAIRNTKKHGETRFPDNPDRIKCQERFDEYALDCRNQMLDAINSGNNSNIKKKIHGKNLQIFEIVKEYFDYPHHYTEVNNDGQLVGDLTLECQALDILLNCPGVEKMIPLIDVSGSMSGNPMYNAIGIGWLITRKTHKMMQNRFITFHDDPEWKITNENWSLCQFVSNVRNSPWGGTTNIEKAMNLILDICVKEKIPNSIVKELNLCILTDMQWDCVIGSNSWYDKSGGKKALEKGNTIINQSREAFKKAGRSAIGEEYELPKIIIWNLRGDINNFAADSSCEGIEMLGGWSQALLKLFLSGDKLEAIADPSIPKPTPYDTYRKAMDDTRYDDIRLLLNDVDEGPLVDWQWYNAESVTDENLVDDEPVLTMETKKMNLV